MLSSFVALPTEFDRYDDIWPFDFEFKFDGSLR